jgi:hypothetical protein
MSVPKEEEMYSPFLTFLSDGKSHSRQESIAWICAYFTLSDSERAETTDSGAITYINHLDWTITEFRKTHVLANTDLGEFHITKRGTRLVGLLPDECSRKQLEDAISQYASDVEVEVGKPTIETEENEKPETPIKCVLADSQYAPLVLALYSKGYRTIEDLKRDDVDVLCFARENQVYDIVTRARVAYQARSVLNIRGKAQGVVEVDRTTRPHGTDNTRICRVAKRSDDDNEKKQLQDLKALSVTPVTKEQYVAAIDKLMPFLSTTQLASTYESVARKAFSSHQIDHWKTETLKEEPSQVDEMETIDWNDLD